MLSYSHTHSQSYDAATYDIVSLGIRPIISELFYNILSCSILQLHVMLVEIRIHNECLLDRLCLLGGTWAIANTKLRAIQITIR